jgi:uncharacterized LabA/DUF88 family protein
MELTYYHAHAFVDGGYLRRLAADLRRDLPDPHRLMRAVSEHGQVQAWGARTSNNVNTILTRTIYYDARPDSDELDAPLSDYWRTIELLPDTHLGFGSLRGGTGKKPPRQKGVDTLIAVDMLVGAFERLFSVAILAAGDADFVPVVLEVRRRGVMVVVAASETSISDELRRSADRFVAIEPGMHKDWFPPLEVQGHTWPSSPAKGGS